MRGFFVLQVLVGALWPGRRILTFTQFWRGIYGGKIFVVVHAYGAVISLMALYTSSSSSMYTRPLPHTHWDCLLALDKYTPF